MNEAELLFSRTLGLSRTGLYLNSNLKLDRIRSREISMVLKRRIMGEPLAYILGETNFMGLDFKVGPGVLIPRQETEILVEEALRIACGFKNRFSRILDLGTGSGCIAIALAKNLLSCKIDALDICEEALKIAKYNAAKHQVGVNFIRSDLFENIRSGSGRYDLIVSNPPYVTSSEISGLEREVRQEPRLALDAGSDGLNFYRRIAGRVSGYLKEKGYLILELGFGQGKAVTDIFKACGDSSVIKIIPDYRGIERVIIIQRKASNGQAGS